MLTLERNLVEQARVRAREQGMSLSGIVRRALRRFVAPGRAVVERGSKR